MNIATTLLTATGESIPLRGLEGVPGLPGAPQDEAGFRRKFEPFPPPGDLPDPGIEPTSPVSPALPILDH